MGNGHEKCSSNAKNNHNNNNNKTKKKTLRFTAYEPTKMILFFVNIPILLFYCAFQVLQLSMYSTLLLSFAFLENESLK